MSDASLFTVRPFPSKQPRSDPKKDSFRIYLSHASLVALKLRAGDACSLRSSGGPSKTAIAWLAAEKNIQNTVVQTSADLQECYGIKVGDKVSVSAVDGPLEDTEFVSLVECTDAERLERHGALLEADRSHWTWALESPLAKCEYLAVGLEFKLELKGQQRRFKIANIQPLNRSTNITLFRFIDGTKVLIGDKVEEAGGDHGTYLQVHPSGLGGMSRQVTEINESLADFNLKQQGPAMPLYYEHSRGMLLHGPKGTGKTVLLRHIETAGWKRTFSVGTSTFSKSVGDPEAKLRNIFNEAIRCQPSVILIDQLEFIAPKRTSLDSPSLASALCEKLDNIKDALVLVVAATRHPNDVDDALRTPHRLAIEIELQVPTSQDRIEILRAIRGDVTTEPSNALMDMIAEKTHGYVGADLFALLQLVSRKARRRQMLECQSVNGHGDRPTDDQASDDRTPLRIQETDVQSALQEVRPTAMREVFLETPKVRWSDIGGQHEIKRCLQKAVERPLKVSIDAMFLRS